jgi:hypothetical protein
VSPANHGKRTLAIVRLTVYNICMTKQASSGARLLAAEAEPLRANVAVATRRLKALAGGVAGSTA